ncbi:MAG TPA: nucleotide sugar dehydrogenase, partial [Oscillospiraceae bacterium]|nr:nucleotide sugar dehydrogenase [Oscillospiraceae bacterium]
MTLVENLKSKKEKLAVVGLGYVGMPLAVAFAKKFSVIGFDINSEKVKLYQNGIDPTNEVGSKAVLNSGVDFTSDEKRLNEAKFIVVAVPTPINADKTPDLLPVTSAC